MLLNFGMFVIFHTLALATNLNGDLVTCAEKPCRLVVPSFGHTCARYWDTCGDRNCKHAYLICVKVMY